jgi:hypothetical protein
MVTVSDGRIVRIEMLAAPDTLDAQDVAVLE